MATDRPRPLFVLVAGVGVTLLASRTVAGARVAKFGYFCLGLALARWTWPGPGPRWCWEHPALWPRSSGRGAWSPSASRDIDGAAT